MLKTNRNWGGIDRIYEVATSNTIKRWEMVSISSGKVANCSSGVPFGVAMQDWGAGDFISVALNLPWVEWEADIKAADLATTIPWVWLLVNDKNTLKKNGGSDTTIFICTEKVWDKVFGYFTANLA